MNESEGLPVPIEQRRKLAFPSADHPWPRRPFRVRLAVWGNGVAFGPVVPGLAPGAFMRTG